MNERKPSDGGEEDEGVEDENHGKQHTIQKKGSIHNRIRNRDSSSSGSRSHSRKHDKGGKKNKVSNNSKSIVKNSSKQQVQGNKPPKHLTIVANSDSQGKKV